MKTTHRSGSDQSRKKDSKAEYHEQDGRVRPNGADTTTKTRDRASTSRKDTDGARSPSNGAGDIDAWRGATDVTESNDSSEPTESTESMASTESTESKQATGSTDDSSILDAVQKSLMNDDDIDASDIDVNVDNGEVTLTGSVTSADEKRAATECVETVTSVKAVHNQLRVSAETMSPSMSESND